MSISAVLLVLASATATDGTPPADPLDRIRCVRQQITGSLARVEKVCHSERDWRRIRNDAEQEARRITQPSFPPPSN